MCKMYQYHPTVYDGGIKLTVDITEKKDSKALLEEKGIIPLSEREKVIQLL